MKKYLILTVTAGEGHNSIAKAIETGLLKDPENQIKKVDIFKEFAKPQKVKFINDGYIFACKFFPDAYNGVFRVLQKRNPNRSSSAPAQSTVKKETPAFYEMIKEYDPDVIICTHFYPSIMITNLRKTHPIKAKVVSVLFDFTVHPFFECATGVDYMFTPDDSLHETLIKKGYKSEQLIPYGLPVNEDFSKSIPKDQARKELSLDPNLFTVMVMLGGGGFGGTQKLVKKLIKCTQPIQICVVNGKDKKGKSKIDKLIAQNKSQHKIVNYGFINFVSTLMSASDILIGKSGGVSVNESMNKILPMALSSNLVAQEYDNMIYLSTRGACIKLTKTYDLTNAVDDLMMHPEKIEEIKNNILKIRKPDATKNIIDFCEKI